jgi:thymidylate kinase
VLIVLEGINGAGKTTLIEELKQHYNFKIYKEPRYLVQNIKDLLYWRETTGQWLLNKWKNEIILLDRYTLSTLIYNVIINKDLSYEDYLQHCKKCVKPDLVIVLTAPLDMILQRRPNLDKDTAKRIMKLYHLYALASNKARLFSDTEQAKQFISSYASSQASLEFQPSKPDAV